MIFRFLMWVSRVCGEDLFARRSVDDLTVWYPSDRGLFFDDTRSDLRKRPPPDPQD